MTHSHTYTVTYDGLDEFNKQIREQFEYGGQKYAGDGKREATDELVDDFGYRWLVGTLGKYVKRFKNVMRERDPLKIACYMYILWLKRGFHLGAGGSEKPVDTNVQIKTENFDWFTKLVRDSKALEYKIEDPLEAIYQDFKMWAEDDKKFSDIKETDLLDVYCVLFLMWQKEYFLKGEAGKDTDTYHKDDKTKEETNSN